MEPPVDALLAAFVGYKPPESPHAAAQARRPFTPEELAWLAKQPN